VRRVFCAALAFVLALLLCACGAGEVSVEGSTETTNSWHNWYSEPATEALTAARGFNGWDKRQPLLIAEDAANNLYLYGLPEQGGVVLIWNDTSHPHRNGFSAWFEWGFDTPRQFMPEMTAMDVDGDGRKEVVVKTYVRSGTGLSGWDLHVVELHPRKYEWTDDWEKVWEDSSFEDYDRIFAEACTFAEEDIQAQLEKRVSYTWDAAKQQVTITDGRNKIVGDIGFDIGEGVGDILDLSSIVDFSFDEKGIRFEGAVGYPGPLYHCKVTANVHYKNGKFTLTDIAIEPWEDQ